MHILPSRSTKPKQASYRTTQNYSLASTRAIVPPPKWPTNWQVGAVKVNSIANSFRMVLNELMVPRHKLCSSVRRSGILWQIICMIQLLDLRDLSVSYKDILVCTQLGTLIERTRYIVTTRYTNSHIQLQYTDEEHMFTVTSARCLVAVATRAPSGFIICLRSRDFHRKNHRTTNDSSPTNSCTCIAITIKQVNYAVELQGDHKTNTKPPIYRIKICQRSNIIRKIQLLQKHGSILYYKLSLIFYTLLNMRHQ